METTKALVLVPASDADIDRIASVDPRVAVLDGRHKFDTEYRTTWPEEVARKFVGRRAFEAEDEAGARAVRAERAALLGEAQVICTSFPFPVPLVSRAPRLRWIHQTSAGASNMRMGDVWDSSVLITSSRGFANSTAHAEWVLGAILMFAKDFPQAFRDKQTGISDRRPYRIGLVAGKTVGIIGLGGIGREVARLAKAVGARVIATRRSAAARVKDTDGVDELFPPAELPLLLAESDFVVIAAQSTPETNGLIGSAELSAMKPSGFLINVARGEIADEPALLEALRQKTIAGAALDVYTAEFEGPPSEELLRMPNVILTPHISWMTDVPLHRGIELFCENLRRYLNGQQLVNVVDRERGY